MPQARPLPFRLALALLFAAALGVRLFGLNWDQGHMYHPDERRIVEAVQELSFSPLELDPKPDSQLDDDGAASGSGLGSAGAGAGFAARRRLAAFFFGAAAFLATAFLADVRPAFLVAFLADFFTAFLADFFADFLAVFFDAAFFADFFDAFLALFFASISFFFLPAFFLPAFFLVPLAIVVLLLPPTRFRSAFKHSRCGGSSIP